MKEKAEFVRLAWGFLLLFFIGKLVVGAMGGSYALGNRLFAMVPMAVHLCLVWGAMTRAFKGHGVGYAALVGVMIAVGGQVLIFTGTLGSIVLDIPTHFSNPVAIFGSEQEVTFVGALGARTVGVVVNGVIGAVAGSIGWLFGRLLDPA